MIAANNLITDVKGLKVGQAHCAAGFTGVTVVIPDHPAVAAIDVRGGGPGTRESDALQLTGTVNDVHGIVLSGGSAFGLAAATGVQSWLAGRGIGFDIAGARIPIVPQAILFDMLNGGDKNWGAAPPYERLGREACDTASDSFDLGSAGAGFGATTASLRGGIGSASAAFSDTVTVGALVAVNAVGDVIADDQGRFLAGPCEIGSEFGGLGPPLHWPDPLRPPQLKGGSGTSAAGQEQSGQNTTLQNTTLAIIATDAALTKAEAHRLAVMAQAGLARAIHPVHSPLDGDVVFALSTGAAQTRPAEGWPLDHLAALGALASNVMARAIARAVYLASPAPPGWNGPPAWHTRFQNKT